MRIRNLALVEDLIWQLQSGFTAVTGETGSGKSIIVGALKLLVGERADKSLVRTGSDSCTVEAVFDFQKADEIAALNSRLDELGVEPCESGQLLLRRSFASSGSNRQFVNGSATTLTVLKELGDGLVDLHGPHDHQSLLSNERQLALLDSFSGAIPLLRQYTELYRHLHRLNEEHAALSGSEAALEREIDLLSHQVAEIDGARLRPDEESALLARYQLASNGRRLLDLCQLLLGKLCDADDAALPRLNEAGKLLRDFERLDPAAVRFSEAHRQAAATLEDLAASLQDYAEGLEIEPAQLAELEERVSLLETLKRKYGGSIGDVILFGQEAAQRLQKIQSRGAELERISTELESVRAQMIKVGEKLGEKRAKAAPKLAASVTDHLRDLGFRQADFALALTPTSKPGPHGLEALEFVFAPNPGEPAKPLRSIASSGEISRVMLAVKSSLAAQDTVSLLVFDEIDANVGGEIAQAVGAKMRQLSESHQVLCISHFPQVAALANQQFVVTKEFTQQRTFSLLRHVTGEERVGEIARMLGGKGESARAHAVTLLGSSAS